MPIATLSESLALEYERMGEVSAPAIVLIAGAGAPLAFWPVTFCERLVNAGFQVIRYSHRDAGFSTHTEQPYDIGTLLQDLANLLDWLGIERAHLVGHSMGGYLVQLALCRLPERCLTGTSISAGPTVTPEKASALAMSQASQATWDVLTANQPTGQFEADLPGWMRSWEYLHGTVPLDVDAARSYTAALYQGDPRNCQVASQHIHAMSTFPASICEELTHLSVRLLVLHGTQDPLVPLDNGAASARLAPGSHFVPLEGVGHMFFHDGIWTRISSELLDFTGGHGGEAD